MQHHYKSSNRQRLPNPPLGCPVSLQLEPSNAHHHNAIKVINDIDTRHLGFIVREMASLHLQPPLLLPCSTNIATAPLHVHDSTDATAPLEPPPQSQVQDTAQRNKVTCMKCKQTGRGFFFQCDQNGCPVLIHECCIAGVVGHTCLFCLFLACRGERFRAKKGSDLYVALKSKYEQVRKSAIQFFGKETFMRLRELAGLDPLLPAQVTGHGKRRLSPQLSHDRACKKIKQASSPLCQSVQGGGLETY